jgi:hypothetical protein
MVFKELDPQAAGLSQAFADTPIGQSLLKLDESQRKRLESLFNTPTSLQFRLKYALCSLNCRG